MCHSYACAPHHLRSPFARNKSVGVGPARLIESSCLLRAATQYPGSSSPVSLLMHSSVGVIWMWMASLSSSLLRCLAMLTTVVSSNPTGSPPLPTDTWTSSPTTHPMSRGVWSGPCTTGHKPSPAPRTTCRKKNATFQGAEIEWLPRCLHSLCRSASST